MSTLYIVGAGTPMPQKNRFGSCSILQLNNDFLMFDCGPASTYKLVNAGLFPNQIDFLFFTHHHSDHDTDYPCFLLTRWYHSIGEDNQLQVFGPVLTELITDRLIGPNGAFAHDLKTRVENPLSQRAHVRRGGTLPRSYPSVEVTDVGPGKVTAHNGWTVTAATVHHVQPWLESLAYRVECADGTIVFAGDTDDVDAVSEFGQGTDVLVANACAHCGGGVGEKSESNVTACQQGTADAATMAHRAGARKLIITHSGGHVYEPAFREEAIRNVSQIYSGEIILADELMEIALW